MGCDGLTTAFLCQALKNARRALTKACARAGLYDSEKQPSDEQVAGTGQLSVKDMDLLKAMTVEQ